MEQTLSLLKALADRNRLRIFCVLQHHDELCACQLTELLGVAGATASRHLSKLVNAGILTSRKEGRWVYFRVHRGVRENSSLYSWLWQSCQNAEQVAKDLLKIETILQIPCEDLSKKQRTQCQAHSSHGGQNGVQ